MRTVVLFLPGLWWYNNGQLLTILSCLTLSRRDNCYWIEINRNVLLKQHPVTFILGRAKKAVAATNGHTLIKALLSLYDARSTDFARPDNEWPFSKITGHENSISVQNIGLSEDSEALSVLPFSRFKPLLALPSLTLSNNNTAERGVVCIIYVFGRREKESERERKGEANCIYEAANLSVP